MTNKETSPGRIRIERIFDAPVELLWRAWTEPELIKLWYGGDINGSVLKVEYDVKLGGKFKVHFADSDGSEHTSMGEFILVEKPTRIISTWEWLSEPGKISEIEVRFFSLGEQTKIILEHRNLSPLSKHSYSAGWNNALEKFQKIVEANLLISE